MQLRHRIALVLTTCALSACNLFGETPEPRSGAVDTGATPDISADTDAADVSSDVPDTDGLASDMAVATDMDSVPDQKPNIDMGDLGDPGDVCIPESEAELCSTVTAECGSVTVEDSCGVMRAPTCGACAGDEVCQNNVCVCVPETDMELCADGAAACGGLTTTDRCGAARTVDCGACTAPETCSQNQCMCIPETDLEFCQRLASDCDVVTAADNCGTMRTADCGACTAPATCGGGGTPNVCACDAQTDAQFCADNGAVCGTVTGQDDCGLTRTVSCGPCTAPDTCGGGGVSGECGCTPETDAELCVDEGAQCGTVSVTDGCGAARTVDCGGCASGSCQSNRCGLTFSATVGEALRHNAPPVVSAVTATGCATIVGVTVDVDITHTYRGDIRLDLVSPAGTARRLKTESYGQSSADLVGNYPLTLTPEESLDVLVGEVGDGDWTITAQDMYQQDQGTFNSWAVNLECN